MSCWKTLISTAKFVGSVVLPWFASLPSERDYCKTQSQEYSWQHWEPAVSPGEPVGKVQQPQPQPQQEDQELEQQPQQPNPMPQQRFIKETSPQQQLHNISSPNSSFALHSLTFSLYTICKQKTQSNMIHNTSHPWPPGVHLHPL